MDKPTLPKGTRDFGPETMAKRQFIFNAIRKVFQKYGFQPLETPAVENLSTLTGKYGDEGEKLMFKVRSNKSLREKLGPEKARQLDQLYPHWLPQNSELGLRYDLTIPFARFVVMNRNEIILPFKRFQIQPVWRGDNPQKGRYREFYQCDADVVGTNSLVCEVEIILMIKEVFKNLGITDYSIKINHRGVLNGIAEYIGATGNETSMFVAIDKLDKIGEEKVKEELRVKNFSDKSLNSLFEMLNVKGSNKNKFAFLFTKFEKIDSGQKALQDLEEVVELLECYGDNGDNVEFDVALARGLSYYTGCIFEVKINNVSIGSVSGGGRYDKLTQAFGDKENLPGVGFSFGVDRIYDAMEELKLFPSDAVQSSKVLICYFDEASMRYGFGVLSKLRNAGIASEIYPDQSKIKKQLDYGNKKMIPYTIVIGSEEVNSGLLAFKNMNTGDQEKLGLEQIIQKLR
jgi:histidyl-tRNA synthetase